MDGEEVPIRIELYDSETGRLVSCRRADEAWIDEDGVVEITLVATAGHACPLDPERSDLSG